MESRTAAIAPAPVSDEVTGRLADQLIRLSRRLHRSQRRLMEPLGITPAQSRLLRVLGHCDEPPRMADLAQRLEVVPRAVTTLVDVLRIELRNSGARALAELRQARRAAAAELLGPLDSGQREALSRLLDVLDEGDAHLHGHGHGHGEHRPAPS